MSLRMWLAVVAVALVGVMLGLDWQSPSVAPPPRTVAIELPVVVPPPAPIAAQAVQAESSNAPFIPNAEDNVSAPRAQATEETTPPNCNVDACERAYRSFRASDCTYQPFDGDRRVCTKR